MIKAIKNRFSPRKFSTESVTDKELKKIFEAARVSPSCYNHQPWFYYWAKKGTAGFEKLGSLLMEGNLWAKEAGVLILACYEAETDRGENAYAQHDLGLASMSLVLQAQKLGYHSHQMAGFDKEKATEVIGMPKTRKPFVMMAIGKLGDEKQEKRERKEKIEKQV